MPDALVRLAGVGVSFGPTRALDRLDLDVVGGRVLALLGANGAGKSTLVGVLAGALPQHDGTVAVDGAARRLATPAEARALGVETVHQRVAAGVVPGLTVAENLVFDELVGGRAVLRRRRLLTRAAEVAAALDLPWPAAVLRRDVAELGLSDAQLLVLARAVARRPRLLVLDEPTSALSAREADRLLAVVRRLRDEGLAVLHVTHRLGEVDAVADRAVVLRGGRLVADTTPGGGGFDWPVLLRAMLGSAPGSAVRRPGDASHSRGAQRLCLRGVRLRERGPGVDLDLHAGEVTGVVGLLGAGKSRLAGAIAGAHRVPGEMALDGRPYAPRSPRDAVRRRVFAVPEDRQAQALLPGWSIARTAALPFLRSLSAAGVVRPAAERARGADVVRRAGVVAPDAGTPTDALSGGNQQKVVVGRWLVADPRVLVLDEPFRGVDVGARRDLGERAREVAAAGAAVLVLSADVDEVLEVADRVVVLVDGAVRLDEPAGTVDRDAVVDAMAEVASPGPAQGAA